MNKDDDAMQEQAIKFGEGRGLFEAAKMIVDALGDHGMTRAEAAMLVVALTQEASDRQKAAEKVIREIIESFP